MKSTLRRPVPLLLALVALMLVGGGTAAAAKLITGKSVKDSSLTGADLKNGSLGSADLSRGAAAALRGAAGARGPAGAAGPAGPTGPKGPTGEAGPAGAPTSYSRDELDALFLPKAGKAANTAEVDGIEPGQLVRGGARVAQNAFHLDAGDPAVTLGSLGEGVSLRGVCAAGPSKQLSVVNDTGMPVALTRTVVRAGQPTAIAASVAQAGTTAVVTTTDDLRATLHVARGPGAGAPGSYTTAIVTMTDAGGDCDMMAQTIRSEIE